jgi:hypothetical protein
MANCKQTESMSVLEHGESVWNYTQKILNKYLEGFRVPNWLTNNYDEIVNNLHSREIIKDYNVLHDCGKPYCLTIDENGKRHFPNHAEVSKEVYLGLPGANPIVGNLIGLDMALHVLTAEAIQGLKLSKQDSYSLLITALAEIHSNASMFGGIESISFKQKWKTLDRRGNMILKGGAQ